MSRTVRVLTPAEAQASLDGLVELLIDAVESGASVNFVWPMTDAKARAWWQDVLASHARGERIILIAQTAEGQIDGTVQLVLASQENQAHRAELAKMLVHRRARRQGLGGELMAAIEVEARAIGRTLLTLDTYTDSDGERLYARMGWTKFGEVPGYATRNDSATRETCSFFYRELA